MKNIKFYEEAKRIVIKENNASISFLQRTLMVGYNTARILIEHFEEDGIVSTPNKNNIRIVLINTDHYGKI